MNLLKKITIVFFAFFSLSYGEDNPNVEERTSWYFNSTDTTVSGTPSNLKYFKFFDSMPDEITLKVFDNIDLSSIGDKKLYVGYGIANPSGDECKVFRKEDTGLTNDTTICLPWWRIEREYLKDNTLLSEVSSSFIKDLRKQSRPPLVFKTCNAYESGNVYQGGKVSCTTYFDKLATAACWDNPQQAACYVNNCGTELQEKCSKVDTAIGLRTTLTGVMIENGATYEAETKVELSTHQYECPSGAIFKDDLCTDSEQSLVFPYECSPSSVDSNGSSVDGEYIYCDEDRPVRTGGSITGFLGTCSDGREVTCLTNKYENTKLVCKEPIYETKITSELNELTQIRNYSTYEVDVISGEPDEFSAKDNCVRVNSTEDARDQQIVARIIGNGRLDDDIYVLRHLSSGTHEKIYCNMQHAGGSITDRDNLKSCLEAKGFPNFYGTGTALETLSGKATLDTYLSCTNDADVFGANTLAICLNSKGLTIGETAAYNLNMQAVVDIYNCGDLLKGGSATKVYNGVPMSCLRNNGSYAFDEYIGIAPTDIVTVQQNSEQEATNATPFAIGRNHYSSTEVVIDGIKVAPETSSSSYPHYPRADTHLRTWDNTTATFSILFPFAGAYELYFYNDSNVLMSYTVLDVNDFRAMSSTTAKELRLGTKMALAPGISEDSGTTLNANRTDPFVEWGGGVYGGKNSLTGASSQSPNDTYVKDNAVTKVVIKDLITGAITPINMVYPLPYPNRIYVAKLKVYEKRKYRCYADYNASPIGNPNAELKHICSTNENWNSYKNGLAGSLDSVQQWTDQSLCEQNCRTINTCSQDTRIVNNVSTSGFTCASKGGQNINGDIEGNFFSTNDLCEVQCYEQNVCDDYTDNQCVIVGEKPTDNITDVTGKTISTKREVSYRCDSRTDIETGCARYEATVSSGDIEYNMGNIGYETKDFSATFEDAMTNANMLEVGTTHIWSGWSGKCVSGMKWDFDYLSDPMTIASYAMSAYSSANWMADKAAGVAAAGNEAASATADAAIAAEAAVDTAIQSGKSAAEIAALQQTALLAAQNAAEAAANAAIINSSGLTSYANSWNSWKDSVSDTFNNAYNSMIDSSSTLTSINNSIEGAANALSNAMDTAQTNITNGIANVSDTIKDGLSDAFTAIPVDLDLGLTASENLEMIADTYEDVLARALASSNEQIISQITEEITAAQAMKQVLENYVGIVWDDYIVGGQADFFNITQGDLITWGAQSALTLAAPEEDDYELAYKLLQGYAGVGNESEMQVYNSCMASIGASLPNLIGWSSSSGGSTQLKKPWEHALRLTPQQLASISTVTSPEYVTSHYMIGGSEVQSIAQEDMNSILINVIAISGDAYLKASQTICMGEKASQAATQMESTNASSGGSGGGFKIDAMMVAKMALSMVCPPCGFALTIVMDLYTNALATIDTCSNEEDALQYDLDQLKTQKFLKNDQCHFVKSYCDAKGWMGCVRTGYDYCCFDQITTRIFAEGIKEQLGTDWTKCNDITINDLKDISFRECGANESPKIDKCFPTGKYSEFQQTLFKQASKGISFDGLSEQVRSSMAIDVN